MEAMRRVDESGHLRAALPAYARVAFLGGGPDDDVEATVLGQLGPGQRAVGEIVDGALVAGTVDEYDVLRALARLRDRGVVDLLDRPAAGAAAENER
jgi:hypothetical protein